MGDGKAVKIQAMIISRSTGICPVQKRESIVMAKLTEEEFRNKEPNETVKLDVVLTTYQHRAVRQLLKQRGTSFNKYVHRHIIEDCLAADILKFEDPGFGDDEPEDG